MPRKLDPRLEGKIIDAAYKICRKQGEQALTMRRVARAAGTTTPTLYERFSDKSNLLALLRSRSRLNLFSAIKSSRTPEQVCRRALDFFTEHPNDYRLISEDWAIAFARRDHMPSFEFMKQRIAAQLGGASEGHTMLALALVALVHGTATLLLSANTREKNVREFRHACLAACDALIRAASDGNSRSGRFPRS
ncbi:MAG TPA: helix-turn-helix domain-containing protein [Candidatus Acidoferrum sp.]|nr:helix-turn-helix domain-containing protein [Candidatus Acidoferrum sp.]